LIFHWVDSGATAS